MPLLKLTWVVYRYLISNNLFLNKKLVSSWQTRLPFWTPVVCEVKNEHNCISRKHGYISRNWIFCKIEVSTLNLPALSFPPICENSTWLSRNEFCAMLLLMHSMLMGGSKVRGTLVKDLLWSDVIIIGSFLIINPDNFALNCSCANLFSRPPPIQVMH